MPWHWPYKGKYGQNFDLELQGYCRYQRTQPRTPEGAIRGQKVLKEQMHKSIYDKHSI